MTLEKFLSSLVDLKGAPWRAPPWSNSFSISCSYLEHLAKLYVRAPSPGASTPLLRGILDLPLK